MSLHDLRGPARREFLKWSGVIAAAIGLERARYLEVLHGMGGYALAQAATSKTRKSIHLVAGSGGLANFVLAFPHPHVAKTANGNYAHHAPGSGVRANETDNEYYYTEGSPFQGKPKQMQMSAFLCNTNQTHRNDPVSVVTGGNSLIATCAAIQVETSAILPAIVVNNAAIYGAAQGAPSAASVPGAAQIVGLFDSAASKGLLAAARAGNATNVQTLHTAMTGLNAALRSPTAQRAQGGSKVAVQLLGQVLADKIRPTNAQLELYGYSTAVPPVQTMIESTAAALNAMGLGLTRMIAMPAFNNDPHGMFAGGDANALRTAVSIGKYFEGIVAHGNTIVDPDDPSKKLADTLIATVTGDTMKEPFQRSQWPDGTPNGASVMYVWGQQFVKKGWFGGFLNDETAMAFNPNTGQNVARGDAGAVTGAAAFSAAAAAVAYAVAAGEKRRIDNFTRGIAYDGLINVLAPQ